MNEMHKIKHVKFAAMEGECNKVVKGYPSVIQLCIRSLITNDHVLLTSVPGLAKTTLANTIGATMPVMRRPATSVVVLRWPCGKPIRNRSPFGQRP